MALMLMSLSCPGLTNVTSCLGVGPLRQAGRCRDVAGFVVVFSDSARRRERGGFEVAAHGSRRRELVKQYCFLWNSSKSNTLLHIPSHLPRMSVVFYRVMHQASCPVPSTPATSCPHRRSIPLLLLIFTSTRANGSLHHVPLNVPCPSL